MLAISDQVLVKVQELHILLQENINKEAAKIASLQSKIKDREAQYKREKKDHEQSILTTAMDTAAKIRTHLEWSEAKARLDLQTAQLKIEELERGRSEAASLYMAASNRWAEQLEKEKAAVATRYMEQVEKERAAAATDARACVSCLDRERSIAFLACGHVAMCDPCSLLVNKCPICRRPAPLEPRAVRFS